MSISYHCDVCGSEVARNGGCKEHPRASIHRVKHHALHSICLLWNESPNALLWKKAAQKAIEENNAPQDAKELLYAFEIQGYQNLTIEESNEILDWAASLPHWGDTDEEPITAYQRNDVCHHCGAEDLSRFGDIRDFTEADWKEVAQEHAINCQWVITRGFIKELN